MYLNLEKINAGPEMKRYATVIGYECLFKCPPDEWQLPPDVVGHIAGIMELEGLVFDRSRFVLLMHDALEKRRKKAEETMIETKLGDVVKIVLEELEVSDHSLNQRIVEVAASYYTGHSCARQGAAELLKRLKKDMKVGLVCNVPLGIPHSIVASQIRDAGMDAAIDDLQFSTEMGMRRPHARQFRYSLSNLNADPSECAAITGMTGDRDTLRKLSFADIFIIDGQTAGSGKQSAALNELNFIL